MEKTARVAGWRCFQGSGAWTFLSPEGRKQNSPGLQAWESIADRFALKGRPTAKRDSQTQRFIESDSDGRPREAALPECRWRKPPAWRAGGAFRAIPLCVVPRSEGRTPQGLRRGASMRRTHSKPRARRSVAKATWAILCSPFGRLEHSRELARSCSAEEVF